MAADLDAYEQRATQTLNAIRCFIDALRSAFHPELSPLSAKEVKSDEFSLVTHLRSEGIFDLMSQLNQQVNIEQSFETHFISADVFHGTDDERHNILYIIVFPLLTHLQLCYAVLDDAPPPPLSQSAPGNKKKNKPQPAKGMLSLNDYANVACLLEFAVCASLLPRMGYHSFWEGGGEIDEKEAVILTTKRARSLPKSLGGRISSQILAWGMHSAAVSWSKKSSSNAETSPDDECQKRITMLHQNCHELSTLALTIGRLVLLDRFRPMLMPRHLTDLYMTLLFLERGNWSLNKMIQSSGFERDSLGFNDKKDENKLLRCLHAALLFNPLQLSLLSTQKPMEWTDEIKFRRIDCREAALACRTLLAGEASVVMANSEYKTMQKQPYIVQMPSWLRMRLGQCLTKLAESDLQAVIDIFVSSCRGLSSEDSTYEEDKIMTSAAARLARALCARPSGGNASDDTSINFQKRLCDQFIDYLVAEGESVYKKIVDGSEKSKRDVMERKLSHFSLAMLYTLWATIGQLSHYTLQSCFVCRLSSGLIPLDVEVTTTKPLSSIQSTSAILVWLSAMPSSMDPSTTKKLHSILLNNITLPKNQSDFTILGQILRLAGSFRQDSGESKLVLEINSVSESNIAMQFMTEMVLNQLVCSLLQREEAHVYSVAIEVVKAIATNQFDREGYAFRCSKSHTDAPDDIAGRTYILGDGNSQPIDILLQGVERRGSILIDAVISPISTIIQSIILEEENCDVLNRIEYSLPGALFRLVLMIHFYASYSTNDNEEIAMKINAKLSEYGLAELLQKDFHASRIAATVLLGFLCEKCSPASILMGKMQGQGELNVDILELLGIIIDCAAFHLDKTHATSDSGASPQELFSTASIVISLLVSLLELGTKKRSSRHENTLQTMLPSLEKLCSKDQSPYQRENTPNSPRLCVQLAELAEMSSHAMALIVARNNYHTIDEQKCNDTTKSGIEWIAEKLSLAERDLRSTQPPLRAKGVVSLRHLARSLENGNHTENKKSIITEVESTVTAAETANQDGLIARSLARICFMSLSDPESYVYLAGIQTLVATCDIYPSEVLPLTAYIIVKGTRDMTILTPDTELKTVTLSFSIEQRIKSAEALIFMIRRRGDAIYIYGRHLLDLMLFGSKQLHSAHQDKSNSSSDISFDIQSQTHSYYMPSGENDRDMEELQVRVNTGGPVFEIEESDLLRATSISIVCELVGVLKPAAVVAYCHILVKLVIDALQLDDSRPVRRAAALLARELYSIVETELSSNGDTSVSDSMAVAMVCSHESILYNVLQTCVSGRDTNTAGEVRYMDVATQSRCTEAIEIRNHLESMSVFDAAAMVAHSIDVEKEPLVKAVRKVMF